MVPIPAHSYRRDSSHGDEACTPRAAKDRAVITAFKLAVAFNLLICLLLLPELFARGDVATANHLCRPYNGF